MAKVLAKAVKFGLRTALFLSVLSAASAESRRTVDTPDQPERCVPAADGSWHCGKDVTEADAAPLPEPQSRSLPPVMLIDPARFGEGDSVVDAPPEASAAEPEAAAPITEVAAEVASPEAASPESETMPAVPTAVTTSARTDEPSRVSVVEPSLPAGGNFAVQLAVASSPRGFDALLAKLGAAARNSQRRQLANSAWVLLIGNFDSIAAARSAIPSSVPGAFARDISTLNFR